MATGDSPGTAEGFMATAEAGGAADAREAIVRLIGLPALRADERLRDLVATAVRITGCQIAVLSLFDATQECEIAAVGTTAEVRPLATSLAHALLTGTAGGPVECDPAVRPDDREAGARSHLAGAGVFATAALDLPDGLRIGCLSVLRSAPGPLDAVARDALGVLARLLAREIDDRRHAAGAAERLRRQRLVADVFGGDGGRESDAAILRRACEAAQQAIGAHMAVASLTADTNFRQSLAAVLLSERYAAWRTYEVATDGSGIYRTVCRDNRTLRLTQAELEAHPDWRGLGDESTRHPPLRGLLAVPLVASDGRNLGLIQLSDPYACSFTAEDEALLVSLAAVASTALENAALAQAARDTEARLRDFAEAASDMWWETDDRHRFVLIPEARLQSHDLVDPAAAVGLHRWDLAAADDAGTGTDWAAHRADLAAHRPFRDFEFSLPDGDGRTRRVASSGRPYYAGDGRFLGYRGVRRDVTQRHETMRFLEEAERRAVSAHRLLAEAIEAMSDGIALFDPDLRLLMANPPLMADHAGLSSAILGATHAEFLDDLAERLLSHADGSTAGLRQRLDEWHSGGNGAIEVGTRDGRTLRLVERRTAEGLTVHVRTDTTELKAHARALEAALDGLRRQHEQLSLAIESIPGAFFQYDREDRLVLYNSKFRETFGVEAEDVGIGRTFEELLRQRVADNRFRIEPGTEESWIAAVCDMRRRGTRPQELQLSDGRWLRYEDRRTASGGMVGIRIDVTESRLRGEQLAQAQKMEAVGQLTGGVAHDFNNLLTVILGCVDMIADSLPPGTDLRALAEMAVEASQRGAALTSRLLAFARRQPLSPVRIDVNRLIRDMNGLLRRTLGEDIDIELVCHAGLWSTLADPSQLEAALLNLSLNARDAMPDGGRLTLETANARIDHAYAEQHEEVRPGQYVMLAVTDSGTGMTREVMERAFDPFFTTKPVGRGSGLGLSMVFGFVKQSGGHVKIYSEPGQGTSVKIYLPRAPVQDQPAAAAAERDEPIRRGTERILLVEDEDLVREHLTTVLTDLGYTVAAFADGPSLLRDLDGGGEGADLLVTDVVLPAGMNGRVVAEAVQARLPGVPVLYISGYTENAIVHHGRLDPDVELLSKPFQPRDLARRVRLLLDRRTDDRGMP